ncbi:kinetochore protein Spc25 [Arapaima gigas]
MACVKDPDVIEHFSSKLEEIRNKLLIQAMGDMVDTEAALCHAQRGHLRSLKGTAKPRTRATRVGIGPNYGNLRFLCLTETCLKKSKDDENMFETIQLLRNDLEQKNIIIKEMRDTIPEVLSEMEDKDNQKDVMVRKINKLKEDQMRKKELIISQNKANKEKLKNLNKAKQMFQDWLGLEIRKIHGEQLQFVFRNINSKDPESASTFILRISMEGSYEVISCDPPLECMGQLEKRLQETNNFSAFLANVRKEFVSLTKT